MSKANKVLRVAAVYHNHVATDRTFSSGRVVAGTEPGVDVVVPLVGIPEGFALFEAKGSRATLRVTSALAGRLHFKGKTQKLAEALESKDARKGRTETVLDADGKSQTATVYEMDLETSDWGVLQLGEVEVVFQFVLPGSAIASAAAFGGVQGAVAGAVMALFSVFGVGLLLSLLTQSGLLFWAFWTDNTEEFSNYVQLDERWVEILTDAEEEEEEEIVEEEEPDIDEAGKRAEDEEGKFGEEDPEDPETVLPDLDAKMVEKLDKPVGIQAALSSNLLGAGGAQSLFGSGATLGDAMDQVAMSGDGDAFNAGFGYGGMGTMGRGAGGGGTGAGRIGGLANRDTGGGRGSGKGLGQKARAKVKPKLKLEQPKQEGFCKSDNIQEVVKKKQSALRNCYERQLLADPELAGKIVVQWKVGLDGKVKDSFIKTSTMKNEKVETCMTRVVSRMRFDQPDGGICVIEFPFAFAPGS